MGGMLLFIEEMLDRFMSPVTCKFACNVVAGVVF
jgi:hypothetical protein